MVRNPPASILLLTLACLGACAVSTGGAQQEASSPGLRVLFIGNSLTVHALIDSARGAGAGPVSISTVAYPNFGLEDHWTAGEARPAISGGDWDLVVLQQGPSATEGRPSLLEYSERFAEEIRAHGARPALYMVWPARARSFDFDGVSESYRMAAERVGGTILPVGDAWRIAWASDSSLALYSPDGFHPSPAGSYLAGLVMYGQFTGRSPEGLPSTVTTRSGEIRVDPETAAVLQAAAAKANKRMGR
jgi:hypothetical protein